MKAIIFRIIYVITLVPFALIGPLLLIPFSIADLFHFIINGSREYYDSSYCDTFIDFSNNLSDKLKGE